MAFLLGWYASLVPLPSQAPPDPPAQEADAVGALVGQVKPLIDQWNQFLQKTAGKPDAAERIERYRKEHGVPLSFWEPGEFPSIPRYVTDHPCGENAIVFVEKVPGKDQPVHGDEVYELDRNGKILSTWGIPIDSSVAGIQGEQLLVPAFFSWEGSEEGPDITVEALLSVRGDGDLRILPLSKQPEPIEIACPASVLPESAYWGCWLFRDLKTKKERRLAVEWPCT